MRRAIQVALVVAIASLFIACGSSSPPPSPASDKVEKEKEFFANLPESEAGAILAEYRNNAVRADGGLEGKWTCVTGVVHRVNAGQFGSGPSVEVRSVNRSAIGVVTMFMRNGEKVDQLNVGDPVKINGKGASTVLGQPIFNECHFKPDPYRRPDPKPDTKPDASAKPTSKEPATPAPKPEPEPPSPKPVVKITPAKGGTVYLAASKLALTQAGNAELRAKWVKDGTLIALTEPTDVEMVSRDKEYAEVRHAGKVYVVETRHLPGQSK